LNDLASTQSSGNIWKICSEQWCIPRSNLFCVLVIAEIAILPILLENCNALLWWNSYQVTCEICIFTTQKIIPEVILWLCIHLWRIQFTAYELFLENWLGENINCFEILYLYESFLLISRKSFYCYCYCNNRNQFP
jgi:hypothetical protein